MLSNLFYILLCISVFAVRLGRAENEKSNAMTARCRANCMDQFQVRNVEDNCLDHTECWMCWDTCNLFYTNYKVWGNMCGEEKICFPGCQESCNFYNLASASTNDKETTEKFPVFRQNFDHERDTIQFEWSKPDSVIQTMVYVVEMLDRLGSRWEQVEQTTYHNSTIRRGLLKSSTRIRLTAYGSGGIVARTDKLCSELDFNLEENDEHFDEMSLDEKYSWQNEQLHNIDLLNSWQPVLNSVHHSKTNGLLDAVVTWTSINNEINFYEVEWKLSAEDCDVVGRTRSKNSLATIRLWPNSVYTVTVKAFINGSSRPVAHSKHLTIDTEQFGSISSLGDCSNCISLELLFGIVSAVATVSLLLIWIVFTIRRCESDKSKKQQPTERTSMKRQLSAPKNVQDPLAEQPYRLV